MNILPTRPASARVLWSLLRAQRCVEAVLWLLGTKFGVALVNVFVEFGRYIDYLGCA